MTVQELIDKLSEMPREAPLSQYAVRKLMDPNWTAKSARRVRYDRELRDALAQSEEYNRRQNKSRILAMMAIGGDINVISRFVGISPDEVISIVKREEKEQNVSILQPWEDAVAREAAERAARMQRPDQPPPRPPQPVNIGNSREPESNRAPD